MPVSQPRRLTTAVLAVAGGLAAWTAFPDLGWSPMAAVGVALLALALRRDSARWNLLVGTLWGAAMTLPTIVWITSSVGAIPWIALSLAEALLTGFGAVAWTWARRGEGTWRVPGLQVVVWTLIWVADEELRAGWPFGGFPWTRLAFSQTDSPAAALAWLGGAPLVSAAVYAAGATLAIALLAARRVQLRPAISYLCLTILALCSGWLVPLDAHQESGRITIAAVQGNVPDLGLDAFDQRELVLDNHLAGTAALVGSSRDIDIVLWPENGSDVDPQVDPSVAERIDAAATAVGAPILVGTIEYPADGGRLNTALLWEPGVGPVGRYSKQHPAPFAEYIPMRPVARFFSSAVDRVTTDMIPGKGVGMIPWDSARLGRSVGIGDVICFEVAYDGIVRDAVAAGAEFIVVQTNNANFGRSAESTQQLAMSKLRAIEHGRAVVQVSTVGVSGVIQPNGAVVATTALFTPDQLVASIPLRTSETPATRWGGTGVLISCALAIITVLTGAVGAIRLRGSVRSPREDHQL